MGSSFVPHGAVLGPSLFSLYRNDICTDFDSEIRLFADDCVCYREIRDTEDSLKLQKEIQLNLVISNSLISNYRLS